MFQWIPPAASKVLREIPTGTGHYFTEIHYNLAWLRTGRVSASGRKQTLGGANGGLLRQSSSDSNGGAA